MSTVSSTSGQQSATQAVWQQLQLEQARRNADQAEETAQSLKRQAGDARASADRAQENARSLQVSSDQAQGDAGQARQSLTSLQSLSQVQQSLTDISRSIGQAARNTPAPAPAAPPTQAVVNTQGQLTGTVVNVTA